MKKTMVVICITLALFCFSTLTIHAENNEKATPAEVFNKVKEASAFLQKNGDEGLKEFMDINGQWVWKDTYVWVLQCEKGTNAAHPIKPGLVGKKLIGIKDTKGKLFFAEFCNLKDNPEGGWVEYMWPKVGKKTPSRKVTYVLQVPGIPYQVAAGIYNEIITLDELKKIK